MQHSTAVRLVKGKLSPTGQFIVTSENNLANEAQR